MKDMLQSPSRNGPSNVTGEPDKFTTLGLGKWPHDVLNRTQLRRRCG